MNDLVWPLITAALAGFLGGFYLMGAAANAADDNAVKRGIWTHKDHAYRLTPIDPTP